MEACARAIRQTGHKVELTIVGDTRARPEYAQLIRNLASSHEVPLTIRENLSDEELDREIASCHVFAFVNIDSNSMLAVYETAARKRAVVLSNSVGAAELLSGLPGFQIIDPTSTDQLAKALKEFIDNPTRCSDLGQAAALTVRDMSWDKMYSSKVESLFSQTLNKGN